MRVAPGGRVAATLSPRSAELISDTLIGRRGGGTRPDDLEMAPTCDIVGAIVVGGVVSNPMPSLRYEALFGDWSGRDCPSRRIWSFDLK
jgi:hypothetical protein